MHEVTSWITSNFVASLLKHFLITENGKITEYNGICVCLFFVYDILDIIKELVLTLVESIYFWVCPKFVLVRQAFLYNLVLTKSILSNSSISNNLEMFSHQLMPISHEAWCNFYHVFTIVISFLLFATYGEYTKQKQNSVSIYEAFLRLCFLQWYAIYNKILTAKTDNMNLIVGL